jgi:hypothetical protein
VECWHGRRGLGDKIVNGEWSIVNIQKEVY